MSSPGEGHTVRAGVYAWSGIKESLRDPQRLSGMKSFFGSFQLLFKLVISWEKHEISITPIILRPSLRDKPTSHAYYGVTARGNHPKFANPRGSPG
eukprot:1378943-Amorphochlora_amoeboformis.AAC.2